MKKVLFGITGLTLGGAERVLIDLANELSDKYDITIFTIYANGEQEKQLYKKVKLKSLYNEKYETLSAFKKFIIPLKLLLLNKVIYNKHIKSDYDVEIAFLEGPITRLFSTKNDKTKKVVWVHNDITKVFGQGIKAKIKKIIDRKIYTRFNNIVFVSKDNLDKFNNAYPDITAEKQVIYNYINKESVIAKAEEAIETEINPEEINFITVARLVEQKAIDRLIRVHSKLIKEGLHHMFYIVGSGPLEKELKQQIKELEVQDTFKLLGKKTNPYVYIKAATYFCLLSHFEGYPMVLLEAQILGKTIIITNTASRETLINYPNGIILENTEQDIYEGLKQIINNYSNKEGIKENLQYDNSHILEEVIQLLDK